MEKVNLFWAIIWSAVAILSFIAIFWNPSHFLTLGISAIMAGMFWYDYRKSKNV